MARISGAYSSVHTATRKSTSQGTGGRGRRVKVSTSAMNKNKKRSYKKYRGQGR